MNDLQVIKLHKKYDELQNLYGSKTLDSIYGAGCINNPDICFIFMNPTARIVASKKTWKGLKACWIGCKNIWKLFYELDVINEELYNEILAMKSSDWNYEFANKLYRQIKESKAYITNLGKCTQDDARALPNKVFKEYLNLLEQEIAMVNPKIIFTFGNQVSSIFLQKNICVGRSRKKAYEKIINNKKYKVYPIYYPIGQGTRNLSDAISDMQDIKKEEII